MQAPPPTLAVGAPVAGYFCHGLLDTGCYRPLLYTGRRCVVGWLLVFSPTKVVTFAGARSPVHPSASYGTACPWRRPARCRGPCSKLLEGVACSELLHVAPWRCLALSRRQRYSGGRNLSTKSRSLQRPLKV